MAKWEKAQDKVERLCHATLQVTAGYQVQDTNAKQALHAVRDFVRILLKRAKMIFLRIGCFANN